MKKLHSYQISHVPGRKYLKYQNGSSWFVAWKLVSMNLFLVVILCVIANPTPSTPQGQIRRVGRNNCVSIPCSEEIKLFSQVGSKSEK